MQNSNQRGFLQKQGFHGVLKSLKFSCIKFKALKSLKLYKKVLIMLSRGLTFGEGKTRIAIWLNVMIKLQKAMISLNKHECCMFRVRCCADLCTALLGKHLYFCQKLHLLAENECAFSIKLLFCSEFRPMRKIDPCFYPANTQSFKCELDRQEDNVLYIAV